MSTVSPDMLKDGWTFNTDEGSSGDAVNGKSKLIGNLSAGRSEIFRPRQRAGAVGQEAQDDRQQRVVGNHPHAQFGVRRLHQCAHRLLSGRAARRDRPRSTSWSIPTSTTASIAPALPPRRTPTKQAFRSVFDTLDEIEQMLSRQRYLVGNAITEADWRLFCTLIRFDAVYYSHFKCNWRHIYEYPNLSNYVRDLYQQPGVAETVEPGADQAALLRQPAAGEPDRHRAGRPAARLRRAARSGEVRLGSAAVIAGLDPAIHRLAKKAGCADQVRA